jgi:hypothetical protein
MKNCNFTSAELLDLFTTLGKNFLVRINKAGNFTVVDPNRKNPDEQFVLYRTNNGTFLWRRFFYMNGPTTYCYPLNMKNRNKVDTHTYEYENYITGEKEITTYTSYNFRNHAEFEEVSEALDYFKHYYKKYRHRDI